MMYLLMSSFICITTIRLEKSMFVEHNTDYLTFVSLVKKKYFTKFENCVSINLRDKTVSYQNNHELNFC